MPSKAEFETYIKEQGLEAAIAAAASRPHMYPQRAVAYLSQELAKSTKPAAPCFYTVVQDFIPGKAEAWWAQISQMGPADMLAMQKKNNKLGYHNHSFMPSDVAGPINCLWECKVDTPPEVFQVFIDGPEGPVRRAGARRPQCPGPYATHTLASPRLSRARASSSTSATR